MNASVAQSSASDADAAASPDIVCLAAIEATVEDVLLSYEDARHNLIPILQDVQDRLGYLPIAALPQIAAYLDLSENDIFGVATFYSQFRFNPPGKHCLKICEGTACHVRGSEQLVEAITHQLGIRPGETTPNHEFSLERVMCLGSCALAPAMVVDEHVYGRMTRKRLDTVLQGSHATGGGAEDD